MANREAEPMRSDPGRRRVLQLATAGVVMGSPLAATAVVQKRAPIKAVAFDAFPIFDPAVVLNAARDAYPELGGAFWRDWFQAVFADTWFRTSARQYRPFIDVAADRLGYACRAAKLTLRSDAREQILSAFSEMTIWPDVKARLGALQGHGVRLVLLSNLGETVLRANIRKNGLDAVFETVLSTDRVQAFKPAPHAYAMALAALGLPKQDIGFAAMAAWDAAGASWFGYRTAWVNRQAQRPEPGALPVLEGRDLSVVAQIAGLSVQAVADHAGQTPSFQGPSLW